MALLDLKTDLKSLKYGRDTPGGGDSGQPYIQSNIPTGDTTSVPFDDGFIRGGAVGAARASIADLKRISSFFKSKPYGTLFIARQVGLQLSNPRPEVRQSNTNLTFISTDRKQFGFEDIGATRIYNLGLNTLAQVPVNAFGVHFYRHGLLPIFGDAAKYEAVATANNQGDGSFNKLVRIATKFELGDQKPNSNANIFGTEQNTGFLPLEDARRFQRAERRVLRRDLRAALQFSNNPFFKTRGDARNLALTEFPRIDPTTLIVDRYIGGPGSIYGVGETRIPRTSNTEDKFKIENALEQANTFGGYAKDTKGQPIELDYSVALGNIFKYDSSSIPTDPFDIKTGIDSNAVPYNPFFLSTSTDPIVVRYEQLKKAIKTNITQSTYLGSALNQTGSISTVNPQVNRGAAGFKYYGDGVLSNSGSTYTYNNTNVFSRDDSSILNIIFTALNPFSTVQSTWDFSAYMTGYKDSFNATWNEINYNGRGETFYIYNKFKRNVSFNLKIPCFNKVELYKKHRELGQLASVTAGGYFNALLGGVILKVKIGNYIDNEFAVLNSIDLSIPDDASWDISSDAQLSMYIETNINLSIIHQEIPRYEDKNVSSAGFFRHLPQ
jgi:hypothetical protein